MISLQAIPISEGFQDLATLIIVASLLVLSVAKVSSPQRFTLFSALLVSDQFFSAKRKQLRLSAPFNATIFLVGGFMVSLFSLFYASKVAALPLEQPFIFFVQTFFGYSLLILTKYILEKIISDFFEIDHLIESYLFKKYSFRHYLLILTLLPAILLISYTPLDSPEVLYISAGLFLILNCFEVLKIYIKQRSLIFKNLFYFILYLCALEIAPYYILYKLITTLQ